MNDQLVTDFVKQAQAAGVPQHKIAALLNKAQEISFRGNTKQASNHLDQVVTGLIQGAGLQKTASSVAYTSGLLKESLDQGATPDQAIWLAKEALEKTSENLANMQKLAEIMQNENLAAYAEGFIKSAMQAGMPQEQATLALINLVEREKQAADPSAMFKQPASPDGDADDAGLPPGAGAGPDAGQATPPGDPSGGQQIMGPDGQPIPPEVLVQLLQMLMQQQGQGGAGPGMPPGGPGPSAGPGPGMPPGGPGKM